MTVCESETAAGFPLLRALVLNSDQTAMRLSNGAGPNCSALRKYSVFLSWPCPVAAPGGVVAGWIEYQMPPASGVAIVPALMCTTLGSVPLVSGAFGIA